MSKAPTVRYRCPAAWGLPPIGLILMGIGPRVRRGYRVLAAKRGKGTPAMGVAAWRLHVEPMSVARAREEIDAGAPHWDIVWDRRGHNQVRRIEDAG